MRNFLALIMCITFLAFSAFPALAETNISAEKKALIDEFLVMFGGEDMYQKYAKQMAATIKDATKQSDPQISSEKLLIIEDEIYKAFVDEMKSDQYRQILYSVYDKNFSVQDLEEMINFYKTPLGQKWLKLMPSLTEDTAQLSTQWTLEIMPKIMERVQKRLGETGKNTQTRKPQ